jgi:serine/threonine protein kinase
MTVSLRGQHSEYQLKGDRPLLSGRLSDIYLANDLRNGDEVALKVFRAGGAEPDSMAAFEREIQALSHLQHAHIVPLLDYGSGDALKELFFLVLPYMKGGNLRALLRGKTFCPLAVAVPLLRQIAEAIDYAHTAGVIHGDIKPENILLDDTASNAQLADFGVARHFDTQDRIAITANVPTRGGGTSAYLSPEQLTTNQQSPKSDIYAFGLVTYELLTGRLPFDINAPLYHQLHARVSGNLVAPQTANPLIAANVGAALLKALDTDGDKRPRTARHFISLLDASKVWDFFIAHAGPDREIAEQLYTTLHDETRTFLDSKCLQLGDDWDRELARAQRQALVTVVLVSGRTDDAFYAREEIASAISMAREDATMHRVVPVYLDARSSSQPPYGLRLKHGLTLYSAADVDHVAGALLELVRSISE